MAAQQDSSDDQRQVVLPVVEPDYVYDLGERARGALGREARSLGDHADAYDDEAIEMSMRKLLAFEEIVLQLSDRHRAASLPLRAEWGALLDVALVGHEHHAEAAGDAADDPPTLREHAEAIIFYGDLLAFLENARPERPRHLSVVAG